MGVQPISINTLGLLLRYALICNAQSTCLFWQSEYWEDCITEKKKKKTFPLECKVPLNDCSSLEPFAENILGDCLSSRGKKSATNSWHLSWAEERGGGSMVVGIWPPGYIHWTYKPHISLRSHGELLSGILNAKPSSSSKPMEPSPLFQAVMPSKNQCRWVLSWCSAKGVSWN